MNLDTWHHSLEITCNAFFHTLNLSVNCLSFQLSCLIEGGFLVSSNHSLSSPTPKLKGLPSTLLWFWIPTNPRSRTTSETRFIVKNETEQLFSVFTQLVLCKRLIDVYWCNLHSTYLFFNSLWHNMTWQWNWTYGAPTRSGPPECIKHEMTHIWITGQNS